MPATPALVVSGYTEEGSGTGPGIARFALDGAGRVGAIQAQGAGLRNPSFAAAGKGVLLAVEELAEGHVVALDSETLELVARTASGGADPCHVALVGETVWVAHYSSGTAAAMPLPFLTAGTLQQAPTLVAHLKEPEAQEGRQASSHAHQVSATAWGSVLVTDLGADRVDEYDAETFVLLGSAQLPLGAGPRHVALKGQYLLVVGELDGCLHVFAREPQEQANNAWRWLFQVPLAEDADRIAQAQDFAPSHMELSADASKLYAAVRGPDTLVVLDVSGLSADPASETRPKKPVLVQQLPSGGKWPRHFAVAGQKMYVANQYSDNVAVFDLDGDGLLGAVPVQRVDFGSPSCVLVQAP